MTSDAQVLLHDIPDEQVVRVLALLLDARSQLPDAATNMETRRRLAAAASDPTPMQVVDDESAQPPETNPTEVIAVGDGGMSDTALARAALDYLVATDAEAAQLLPRAIRLAAAPDAAARAIDPLTLGVGGLVLAVLKTEVSWTRTEDGRWRLRIHKRAMGDSTIATLVRGVLHLGGPDTSDKK